jgi:hypothetical protein
MSTGTPVIAVQNMPPEYLEKFNASRAYIVNITDTEYYLSRSYGNYHIPAKAAGEAYSIIEITPRKGTMDMGDKRVFDFPITPGEVATDLCREINIDAGFDSFLGVFIPRASLPTDAELRSANARLEKFYQWGVAEGDKIWQQTRAVILIPDWIKRAAEYLKLERDWKTNVQPNLDCPACGGRIKPGLALCSHCGALLDEEKARKFFPDRFAPLAQTADDGDLGRGVAVIPPGETPKQAGGKLRPKKS